MKVFGQHVPVPILVLAVTEYSLAALAFGATAYFPVSGEAHAAPANVMPWSFLFGTAVLIGLTAVGLYQPRQRLRLPGIFVRLLAALVLALVCLALVAPILPSNRDGSLWGLSLGLSLALLVAARVTFDRFVDHDAFRRRVLVYGAGDRAASLLKLRRRSDQRGFRITAFVRTPGDRSTLNDPRVIPAPERLAQYAKENRIDEIVVAMDERRDSFPMKELLDCRFSGIEVIDLLNFLERETGRISVDLVNPAWLIFSDGFSGNRMHNVWSRALDLLVGTLLTVLTLPLMLAIAVAIAIEDGLPILYRQERVGLGGKPFTLYKFRSMVKDAESDGRARWADNHDSRITRVGRVIRKLRFDELPQLFNVLRGDMSLVGPRPERPEFVALLSRKIPYYHERHSVKPGITGWAQLCYPYGSSESDAMHKLQYDLYYIKHRSLSFDLMVILQTVEVVLWGKGAR